MKINLLRVLAGTIFTIFFGAAWSQQGPINPPVSDEQQKIEAMIAAVYPNWVEIVRSQTFKTWLTQSSTSVRVLVNSSNFVDAIWVLDLFMNGDGAHQAEPYSLLLADSDEAWYVDISSIKKTSNVVRRAWAIHDLKVQTIKGVRSERSYAEYNCQEDKERLLELDSFDGKLAQGKPTVSYSYGEPDNPWHFVRPNSISEAFLKMVCAKKL